MSTNSLVAYLREDGSVVSSYVHYDGYATGVGEMLLENYNTDKCARDLATTLGYASSLKETISESHKDRANTDEAEVFEDYHEFEEYIRECSHLEYVYVWDTHKDEWLVATWETTKRKVHNGICSDYEFESHWNGFESLITLYVREGRETAVRYRKMVSEGKVDIEYLDYASELEDSVLKWNRIGVSEIARDALAIA